MSEQKDIHDASQAKLPARAPDHTCVNPVVVSYGLGATAYQQTTDQMVAELSSLRQQLAEAQDERDRARHLYQVARALPPEFPADAAKMVVCMAYKHVEISEGRACELLKMDRITFRELFATEYGEQVDVDVDDLKQQLAAVTRERDEARTALNGAITGLANVTEERDEACDEVQRVLAEKIAIVEAIGGEKCPSPEAVVVFARAMRGVVEAAEDFNRWRERVESAISTIEINATLEAYHSSKRAVFAAVTAYQKEKQS